MRTIVIADAVMGLDNVLAVAGAAHGSFLLVVLGLLISIPIVIWGSQLILGFVQRYPSIVYLGAAVLLWTGVKMMLSEPLIKPYTDPIGAFAAVIYASVIGGVLFAGYWMNHAAARSRVARHLADAMAAPVVQTPMAEHPAQATAPHRVLIPVDGSSYALHAVKHVADHAALTPGLEVHLLHVRSPLANYASRFAGKGAPERHQREVSGRVLRRAREWLDLQHIPCALHVASGPRAATITREAARLKADRIVMGTARRSTLTRSPAKCSKPRPCRCRS
jgi:nucleotide-binding universal stress UspA family protein